jgi:hypothetical protein
MRKLGVVVTPGEIDSAGSINHLAPLVESRLLKSLSGKTLKDIYEEVGRFAREEYHPKIPYHWCAKWNDFLKVGNWSLGRTVSTQWKLYFGWNRNLRSKSRIKRPKHWRPWDRRFAIFGRNS